jgi:hypothetical protein
VVVSDVGNVSSQASAWSRSSVPKTRNGKGSKAIRDLGGLDVAILSGS